jgi:hypothetical protein
MARAEGARLSTSRLLEGAFRVRQMGCTKNGQPVLEAGKERALLFSPHKVPLRISHRAVSASERVRQMARAEGARLSTSRLLEEPFASDRCYKKRQPVLEPAKQQALLSH